MKKFISIVVLVCFLPFALSCGSSVDPIDKYGKIRLCRIPQKGWIGGVCAGFAYWLGWPAWLIRVALVLSVFVGGIGILFYVLLWIFMPVAKSVPKDYEERAVALNFEYAIAPNLC